MSKRKEKPVSEMKPKGWYYSFLYHTVGHIVRFTCNIHVTNPENEPKEGGVLIIANHRVWCDPIYMGLALKHLQPHFMAKKESFNFPPLALLIRALGAYPVNRGGADVGAIKRTIEMLKHGIPVGMFPQGHRYPDVDARTTPVKTGAALIAVKAGVPVMPIFIKVKNNHMHWFCRKELIFGKVITPEEIAYNPENPGEYQRIADFLFEKVCELGDD